MTKRNPDSTRNHRSFSILDDEVLRKMASEGATAQMIADELGRTRNSIIGRCNRMDIRLLNGSMKGRKKPRRAKPKRVPMPQCLAKPPGSPPKAIEPKRLTITQLKPNSCRWPLGDPSRPDFRYCGAHADTWPYCQAHRALAYNRAA